MAQTVRSPSPAPPFEASQNDAAKIFVGNLPFKVNNTVLSSFFSAVGKVAEAKVISRRGRSKGYGFVTFENEKDAIRAYNSLNKAQFEDREINIELAKPRDPKAEPPPYPPRAFQPSGFQGGYRGRHRGGRGGKRVSDRKDAPQSTTTLFISNLPYKIDDESLSKVFDGYDIVKSYVVTTRYGRSRGYGFVEFSSEPEQQRALKNLNNVVIDERQLTVRIAFEQAAKEESPDSETAQA